MKKYKVRSIYPEFVEKELFELGFDKAYLVRALKKYSFNLLKISNLKSPAANILKQTALSKGADLGVASGVVNCVREMTDAILECTDKQLELIVESLKEQPYNLKLLALELESYLHNKKVQNKLVVNNKVFTWGEKTYLMGVLNLTPDSFSDGGNYCSLEKALSHVQYMVQNDVDIIDIGGESTRPYSSEITSEEQLNRILPVLREVKNQYPELVISIDTRSADVAEKTLQKGANIINDVSGLTFDNKMIKVLADYQAPVILVHSQGIPENMQIAPRYSNLIDEIFETLLKTIEICLGNNISADNIILDPGVGFGKTIENNLEIIQRVGEFKSLGCPILMGTSRKSFIANILDCEDDIISRDIGTVATNTYLISQKVDIIRAHNVQMHSQVIKMLDGIVRRS